MPDLWATSSSLSARESQAETSAPFKRDNSVPADRGAFAPTRWSRGARVRSVTRAPSTHPRGQNLTNAEVQRRRLAEEKQQLQDKKEEAWELFQRQPNWGSKRREDFEREYKQKSRNRAFALTFRFRQKGGEVLAGMGGQVARASRLVTSPECGPLTNNVVNPGKYATRIPLAHHQPCPKFCIVMNS